MPLDELADVTSSSEAKTLTEVLVEHAGLAVEDVEAVPIMGEQRRLGDGHGGRVAVGHDGLPLRESTDGTALMLPEYGSFHESCQDRGDLVRPWLPTFCHRPVRAVRLSMRRAE